MCYIFTHGRSNLCFTIGFNIQKNYQTAAIVLKDFSTGGWLKCWNCLAKYGNYFGFHLLPIPFGEMTTERGSKETRLAFPKHKENG